MRRLPESDLFSMYINKNNTVLFKVGQVLSNVHSDTVILNSILLPDIKKYITSKKKDMAVSGMTTALERGKIKMFITSPEHQISPIVPFVIYKHQNSMEVAVNMATIVRVVPVERGVYNYEITGNVQKVYGILMAAYHALLLSTGGDLTPDGKYHAAVIWAEMFCKPLFDAIGLSNTDRFAAFIYFAMKFFLVYYLGLSEEYAEKLAMKRIQKKNELIVYMQSNITNMGINIYEGIIPFLKTIFNANITKIQGLRVGTIDKAMNVEFYLNKFTAEYSSNAILSLCSYPYFAYAVYTAYHQCRLVRDNSFDRIFKNVQRDTAGFVASMFKL